MTRNRTPQIEPSHSPLFSVCVCLFHVNLVFFSACNRYRYYNEPPTITDSQRLPLPDAIPRHGGYRLRDCARGGRPEAVAGRDAGALPTRRL